MIIRDEQRKAFRPLVEEALVSSIYDYLRAYPDPVFATLSKNELEARVKRGIEKGRQYGLTWEASLCAFVGLTVLIAPNFDLHPAVNKILTDKNIEPNERPITLVNDLSEADWEAAQTYR